MLDIIHTALRQLPIFEHLDLKAHRNIIEKIELMYYPAGYIIFQAGDEATDMYIVKSGEIEIFIEENGMRKGVAGITTGGFFGEMALIEETQRAASAEAMTDVEVFVITKDILRDLMAAVPGLDMKLVEEYLRRKQENTGKHSL